MVPRSRLAVVGVLLLLLGLGAAPTASAAAGFAVQARASGLTQAQTTRLQDEVDGYLARWGGRQVAANRVERDGAVLTVAVPGEERSRSLAGQIDHCRGGWVDFGWFCAYEREDGQGSSLALYSCAWQHIPWLSVGSWQDNQTPGTRSTMYFVGGASWHMPAAPSWQRYGVVWGAVTGVRNC
ncbi:hypothetical protein LV78_000464 [Actinosynnema pretiosum]|nr:hypothetical protein [Actinosynnema pretiosum]